MNDKTDSTFDDELMAAASNLATGVKPERDLWPEIEQAIAQPAAPRKTVWNTVWAQAAAVLLLVGGSSGLTYYTMSEQGDPVMPAVTGETLIFQQVSGNFGGDYHLGPDYQDARRDLQSQLAEEMVNLSPETQTAVETNLTAIRQAIEEINKALEAEPENVLLQNLLISTYKEELALMQRVDNIANTAMYRGDI